jgi:ADP-heptose:LPS heptosyltransferase
MGRDWRQRIPQPIKRRVRSLGRWLCYPVRLMLTSLFRRGVDALRAFHVLPKPCTERDKLRLLIVHLTSHLGDTILVMPLIEALRAANPDARIEFAVEEAAAPLLRRMPQLDHVYALPLGREPPVTARQIIGRSLRVLRAYWAFMRNAAPSVCLLPRWDNDLYRSSLLAYLTGAPRRVGFSWRAVPGAQHAPYRDALLTNPIEGGDGMHEAARFCLLAAKAGLVPETSVSEASSRVVTSLQRMAADENWPALAERLGIERGRPFAVISPGASMLRRLWPRTNWTQVCARLEAIGYRIVLLSGRSDKEIAEGLYEESGKRPVLVAGKTSLLESAAILQHASLFLGSDSGPGHVAGALGTPAVILFVTVNDHDRNGISSPERIRPIGPSIVCCCPPEGLSPCEGTCHAPSAHCITLITPDVVMAAADAVLRREPSKDAS